MWLLVSAPLGLTFGMVAWAFLRGRGGFFGLVLFALAGAMAAFVGGFAAEALAGYQSDFLTGMGAGVGAFLASVFIGITVGTEPLTAPSTD